VSHGALLSATIAGRRAATTDDRMARAAIEQSRRETRQAYLSSAQGGTLDQKILQNRILYPDSLGIWAL
jgi:hypothetical protein